LGTRQIGQGHSPFKPQIRAMTHLGEEKHEYNTESMITTTRKSKYILLFIIS
jgi:hypothetical protein